MAEIYNVDRFAELFAASQSPPVDHLGLAAEKIAAIFQVNSIVCAFLGGWATFLRGSGRKTMNVDIAVNCPMVALIKILKLYPYLIIPQYHGNTALQTFILTGGNWDYGLPPIPINVNIIIQGSLGLPANMPAGTEFITPVATTQGKNPIRVIDFQHQISTKLSAYYSRHAQNDYDDILFLFRNNIDPIFNFSYFLDLEHRKYFAEAYDFNNPQEDHWSSYVRLVLRLC